MKEFQNFCLSLPKATEDYPFGDEPLVIKVNNKMFAIINNNEISLKCEPFKALEYREMFGGVRPGYHLNKKHWNTINIESDVPKEIIKAMIKESYEAVIKTFSKKEREKIYN